MGLLGFTQDKEIVTEATLAKKANIPLEMQVKQLLSLHDIYVKYVEGNITREELCTSPSNAPFLLKKETIGAVCDAIGELKHTQVHRKTTGAFVTQLIQYAYDQGENDFIVNTHRWKGLVASAPGYKLKGTPQRRIKITIEGPTHNSCGAQAEYAHFRIYGDTGQRCGEKSKHCFFEVQGFANGLFGAYAHHFRGIYTPRPRTTPRSMFLDDHHGNYMQQGRMIIDNRAAKLNLGNIGTCMNHSTLVVYGSKGVRTNHIQNSKLFSDDHHHLMNTQHKNSRLYHITSKGTHEVCNEHS